MKAEAIDLLVERGDIHDYVLGLWSDGPIRRSHESGGFVHGIVDRFARLPRFFYKASDERLEWTHFSTWWGGILLGDYDNVVIRDLRYLHEIYHAATLPYVADCNLPTFELKAFRNEREASTFTEMAVYLELPELRAMSFDHPIFVDRFLFPEGDLVRPDLRLLERWRSEPDLVFQELMYERIRVVTAEPDEVDAEDPQIVWLRRYKDQGANWIKVWTPRFRQIENAMIALREQCRSIGRAEAAKRHLDWLLSKEVADGTAIPFHEEAVAFRSAFDALITAYDEAMTQANQVAVRNRPVR